MTVDELIKLTEALVGNIKLSDLQFHGPTQPRSIAELDPDDWMLLVRFVGGERPPVPQPTVTVPFGEIRKLLPDTELRAAGLIDDDDDDDVDLRNAEGRIELGGDGGTVLLP